MARKVGYLPHSEARNYLILLIFASSCYVEAPNIHKTGYGPDIADPKTGMISIFFYLSIFVAAGSCIFLSSLATKLPAACYELQKRWSVICLHRQMKFPPHSMITPTLFFYRQQLPSYTKSTGHRAIPRKYGGKSSAKDK